MQVAEPRSKARVSAKCAAPFQCLDHGRERTPRRPVAEPAREGRCPSGRKPQCKRVETLLSSGFQAEERPVNCRQRPGVRWSSPHCKSICPRRAASPVAIASERTSSGNRAASLSTAKRGGLQIAADAPQSARLCPTWAKTGAASDQKTYRAPSHALALASST